MSRYRQINHKSVRVFATNTSHERKGMLLAYYATEINNINMGCQQSSKIIESTQKKDNGLEKIFWLITENEYG